MRYKLNDYIRHIPTIERMIKMHKYKRGSEIISDAAIATGVPCLVVAYFIKPLVGEEQREEMDKTIKIIADFYKATVE